MSKHHYVPQFLLRNWTNEKGLIGIYLLKSNKKLRDIPKQHAQEENLYGKDQKVEKLFSSLESEVAPIIKRLTDEDFSRDLEDIYRLKTFIATQYARVPLQVDIWNEIATSLAKHTLSASKDFDADLISNIKVSFTNPVPEQLRMIIDYLIPLLDLKFSVIRNNTERDFIIGQNPIVILNPLLVDRAWLWSRRGIGLIGAVLIMPISPKHSICLYDRDAYGITDFARIGDANESDVELLNLCQFYNAGECIYFKEDNQSFDNLAKKSEEYRINPKSSISFCDNFVDENGKKLLHESMENYPIKEELSFLHIKEKYYELVVDSRNVCRSKALAQEDDYKKSDLYRILHQDKDGSSLTNQTW